MSDYHERILAMVGGMERFARSFDNRTHYPERVAASAIEGAVSWLTEGAAAVRSAGGTDAQASEWEAAFLKRWMAYQSADGRTASSFITGPANFPVERNRKRQQVAHARLGELLEFAKGAGEWMRRRVRSAERAALSEQAAGVEHEQRDYGGVRLVLNKPLDRVQLLFPGKPDAETITELKGRAFRWSPREGAWQRQLTRNGIEAAKSVVKSMGLPAPTSPQKGEG